MSSPIPDLILAGACDEDIEIIFEAARQRRIIVAERRAVSLLPGDEFDTVNISPKKLAGVRVSLISHDGNTLRCELLDYVDRRYPRGHILLLRRTHVGTVYPKRSQP